MKKFVQSNWGSILLGITGALGGFFYWRYIGCLTGTCIIQSTWYLSTLWGAVLGVWIGSFFNWEKICKSENK